MTRGSNRRKDAKTPPLETIPFHQLRNHLSSKVIYTVLLVFFGWTGGVAYVVDYLQERVISQKDATIESLRREVDGKTTEVEALSRQGEMLSKKLSDSSRELEQIHQHDLPLLRAAVEANAHSLVVCVADIAGPAGADLTNVILGGLRELSQIQDLRVIPLREVFSERDDPTAVRSVGVKVGANVIVWGWQASPGIGSTVAMHIELVNVEVPDLLRETFSGTLRALDLQDPTSMRMVLDIQSQLNYLVGLVSALKPYLRGDYKAASENLQEVVALEVAQPGQSHAAYARFFLGSALLRLGHYRAATEQLAEAVLRDPTFVEAHYGLGTLYLRIGQVDEAEQALSECIRLESSHGRAKYNLGVLRARLGQIERAEEAFLTAMQSLPEEDRWLVHEGMAKLAVQSGRYLDAAEFASRSLEAKPTAEAYHTRALARGFTATQVGLGDERQELLQGAISDLTSAMSMTWMTHELMEDRAHAFYLLERFDELERDLELIVKGQDSVSARVMRGVLRADRGELGEAVEELRAGATLLGTREGGGLCYYMLGRAYYGLKDSDRAIEAFSLAIALNGTVQHYNARAFLLGQVGRHEEALADFSACVERSPDDPVARKNRGTALAHLGRIDEAIADLSSAISLNPKFALAFFERGKAKLEKRDLDGAEADAMTARELARAESNGELVNQVEQLIVLIQDRRGE